MLPVDPSSDFLANRVFSFLRIPDAANLADEGFQSHGVAFPVLARVETALPVIIDEGFDFMIIMPIIVTMKL